MNKLIIRLSELVGIVCLIAFIIFVSSSEELSTTDPQYMSEQVLGAVDIEGLNERDGLFLKKKYGIDSDSFEHFTYYSSDSVMDVREYLIIKLDGDQSKQVIELIESALKEKQTLFKDYAPLQSALLESRVLVYEKGYLLFAVGDDASSALSAFKDNL